VAPHNRFLQPAAGDLSSVLLAVPVLIYPPRFNRNKPNRRPASTDRAGLAMLFKSSDSEHRVFRMLRDPHYLHSQLRCLVG
jgi:hypothetical protein